MSDIDHCLNRTYSTDLDIAYSHQNLSPANSGGVEFDSIQVDNKNGTGSKDANIFESDVILNIDSSYSTDPALWPMKLHTKRYRYNYF